MRPESSFQVRVESRGKAQERVAASWSVVPRSEDTAVTDPGGYLDNLLRGMLALELVQSSCCQPL
jgi:hypothetical protein